MARKSKKQEEENDQKLKEKMFEFLTSWVENEPQNREAFFANLLKLLPLHKLSSSFLHENVSSHPLVNNSLQCLRLLTEALNKTRLISPSNPVSKSSYSKVSHLFYLGGKDQNDTILSSVSKLSTTNREWKSSPEMFTAKFVFGATVIGRKIYVCGGYTGRETLKELEVFDCENNTLSILCQMPISGNWKFMAMTALNGLLFVSGGYTDRESPYSNLFQYSLDTNTWTELKQMDEGQFGHKLIVLNGLIYSIGEWKYGEKKVKCYNPDTNEWNYVTPFGYTEGYDLDATLHHNRIYALAYYSQFKVYDPELNTWEVLPYPRKQAGDILVSINNELLFIEYDGESKIVSKFDTTNNSWNEILDLYREIWFDQAAVVHFSKL